MTTRYAVKGTQGTQEFFLNEEFGPLPARVHVSGIVKAVYTQQVAEAYAAEMNTRTPNTTWSVIERNYI